MLKLKAAARKKNTVQRIRLLSMKGLARLDSIAA